MRQSVFYNEFIIRLYMLRAQLCPSSGGQNCITQRLASSHSSGGRPVHLCIGRLGCLSLVAVVTSQAEVSALGWSFVQRSPTECGVSERDRKASIMRKPWPTRGCYAKRGGGRFTTVVLVHHYN